jgi:hypothetical protein
MANAFSDQVKKAENKDGEIKELHAKIGQLAVEREITNGAFWYLSCSTVLCCQKKTRTSVCSDCRGNKGIQ